jgi:hypothetical protein
MKVTPKPTRQERKSEELISRFVKHIKDWWPGYEHKEAKSFDFNYIVSDPPHELWSCALPDASEPNKTIKELWMVWDGGEVYSDRNAATFMAKFCNDKKERRIEAKLAYLTSPGAVSAYLALAMTFVIACILLLHHSMDMVPAQLWTVYTAVIAFYFGRQNFIRNTRNPE